MLLVIHKNVLQKLPSPLTALLGGLDSFVDMGVERVAAVVSLIYDVMCSNAVQRIAHYPEKFTFKVCL